MTAGEFIPLVTQWADKPINYVEIGVYNAGSASWMARKILTHPDSRGYGIDPFTATRKWDQAFWDGIYDRACEKLKPYDRFTILRGKSREVLRTWDKPIDLLYIDGSHWAENVLADFVLAWPHLKVGSGIIFDDYGAGLRKSIPHVPEAVTSIQKCYDGMVETWAEKWGRQASLKVTWKDRGIFEGG